jgi:hypothetical protein
MADRLKILNKKSPKKINFTITDLKDEDGKALGTKVKFIFPVFL